MECVDKPRRGQHAGILISCRFKVTSLIVVTVRRGSRGITTIDDMFVYIFLPSKPVDVCVSVCVFECNFSRFSEILRLCELFKLASLCSFIRQFPYAIDQCGDLIDRIMYKSSLYSTVHGDNYPSDKN